MTQVLTFSQALDWIKLHLDIVDVVGRTVQLKRAGRNLMGLCPFHAEKSPSFTVNHEKQMFKCFGCGEGGDSLTFLMKINNKSFGEVIADLAEENDIEILRDGKAPNPEAKAEREKLIELHHKAAVYYRDMLMATAMPQDYLKERGLPSQIQSQFGIGYAPPGWRHLEETLKLRHPELEVTPKNLEKIGLLISKEDSGNHYDRFRNRLMVSIHDEKGNVVAFGARALDPADEPKYLNSPETELYVKHRILFGLHLAKSVIREKASAIVMEGYFDVMSAHMAGLKQAVGVCGTALTADHLKLLSRAGAKNIYLCFDTDKAGQNATYKTLETLQPLATQQNLMLKVVTLPIGKDPDEFFRSDNADIVSDLFNDLMTEAKDGWTYQFDTQLALIESPHTMEGRIQAAGNVIPILQRIEKPVLQHEWIRQLAKRIGITEESLHLELKQAVSVKKLQNNPYEYKKSLSPGAIPDLPSRYIGGSTFKNGSKKPFGKNAPKGFSALGVQEDVREMRRHLAPKNAMDTKEASFLSYAFLSESTWDYMMTACEHLELSSPEAHWFMQCLKTLSNELQGASTESNQSSIDHRIVQLRKRIHTDAESPEARYRMLRFLADRVFEAEKLAKIYIHPTVASSATANVTQSLTTSPAHEKLWRIIDTMVASLKLSKEKVLLGQMLEELRSSEIAGDEASARLEQELKHMVSNMRVSLGQQSIDRSPDSENTPSPNCLDTASTQQV